MWFLSGMVLAYWDFPEVTERDAWRTPKSSIRRAFRSTRRKHMRGWSTTSLPNPCCLLMFDGRPAYRFDHVLVYADDGQPQTGFPPELTPRRRGGMESTAFGRRRR